MKKGLPLTIALLQFRDYYCRPALRRPHRPPRLEALPAEDRPSLRGSEGNGCFLAALRTGCLRFGTYLPATTTAAASGFGSFGFAGFAALRFVLKSLVGEKHLLAGSKNELGAALGTLQHLIVEFHGRFPPEPPSGQWGRTRLSPWARNQNRNHARGTTGQDSWAGGRRT
jgi:hypothetical protein